ncbi:MAG: LamG domain-containing protein, partial [Planctomycetota bacterium]
SNPGGANDVWLHYSDDVNVNDPYLIDGFKLRFVSTISSGTVYIDNVKITNTWPVAGQWFDGQETTASHTVLVDPNTRYYWRVDTVVDGNEYKGDTWSFITSMIGGVVFHLDFGGTAGNVLPSSITYSPTNVTFNKYTSDGNEVRYSADNGYGLSGYTSADFDWGSGLYRDDLGGPTDLDPLRLDGYQYTVELWIKPVMPPDNQIDEARLIGRDNSWEIVLNDIGPNYDDGFELLWYHGQEGISRDNISQLMKLAEYGETEWMHIAAVHNLLAFRKQMLYLNGEVIQTEGDYLFNPSDNNEPVGIACDWDKSGTIDMDDAYVGKIDEVRVLDIALTPDQFLLVPGPEWAGYPNPSHGAIDIDPCDANIVLSWIPGTKAETHKVYFSTDFEDVNSSNADALVANLPVETNSWPAGPDGLTPHLDFGNVYYWRVTEVNGLDTWPGVIWDFTTKYELIDPDMLLWYKFDDSGEKVIDASGYGTHGNLEMDEMPLPPWGPGKFEGCLRLDDDKAVSVPLDVLHTIDDQISISIWLYGQSVTGDNIVLQAGNADTNCVEIQVPDYSRDVYWRAGNDVNDVLTWEAVNVRALEDNWHHFVFIKDEADDKMSIYFDGELKWWKEDTSVSLTDLRDKPFRIGAEVGEDDDYVGWMDDFRIYNIALSETKILELFRGG